MCSDSRCQTLLTVSYCGGNILTLTLSLSLSLSLSLCVCVCVYSNNLLVMDESSFRYRHHIMDKCTCISSQLGCVYTCCL